MHQNAFGGWALPGPTGGAYSAPPGPLAGLKGKEREGEWERAKGKGVQRHPRRRKMRHRNPHRDKNTEVGGTKFKFGQLIFRKIIKIGGKREGEEGKGGPPNVWSALMPTNMIIYGLFII